MAANLPANAGSAMPNALFPEFDAERRRTLRMLAAGAVASALPWPTLAPAQAVTTATDPRADWRWLVGNWDVRHRRLRERLAGSDQWDSFAGRSAAWLTLDGLGTIDDNEMELPGGAYRGMGIRAFDPATRQWAIWWLDARDPTRIEPPVRGGFDGEGGTFLGRDTLRGKPILMRFRWHDIHGPRPWWEQAFSDDDGARWEVNWRNWFTRTAPEPTPLPRLPQAPDDWNFLIGRWQVAHRRRPRLSRADHWDDFDGTLHNWPVLGGFGNVGDNLMRMPTGEVRGMGIRALDSARGEWSSWWLDGRAPDRIGAPLRGHFRNGEGVFTGEEIVDGRSIRTRVIWSRITPRSARWEQASSTDGGTRWDTDWISDFTRTA